jgi:hypothetical protein
MTLAYRTHALPTTVTTRIFDKGHGSVYNEDKRLGFLHNRLPNSEKQIQMEMISHRPVAAVMTVYKTSSFTKKVSLEGSMSCNWFRHVQTFRL